MRKPKFRIHFIFIFLATFIIFGFGLVEQTKAATILSENFDSYCPPGSMCVIPPPNGWWREEVRANWFLGRPCGTIYRGTGSYAASAYQNDFWNLPSMLVTKGLNMVTNAQYTLQFYVRIAGTCAGGDGITGNTGLRVYRSTSQTVRGTTIGNSYYTPSTTWTQITINFTVPSNGTYYIQFDELYSSRDYIVIDDVTINETITNQAPTISSVTDSPDPVTAGNPITFTVYWSDPNAGDLTKIHICKTNAISGQTCSGGSWCDTTSWSSTSPTQCSYTTQSGDVGTKNYYAFVCDDDNACSSGVAGTFTVITSPTVPTEIASINLQSNTATLRGNITNTGGQNADLRGFEWGTSTGSYPNSWTEGTSGSYQYTTGIFSYNLTGMTAGTTYYYRAKAHNSVGWNYGGERRVVIYTAYGDQKQFTTLIETNPPKVLTPVTGQPVSNWPEGAPIISMRDYCYSEGTGVIWFQWGYRDSDGDPESRFELQIDDNPNFSSPEVNRNINGGLSYPSNSVNEQYVYVVPSASPDKLTYGKTYYWQVRVWDNRGGNSGWISGSSFSTPAHPYPWPDFDWSPKNPTKGEVIQFSDKTAFSGTNPAQRSWLWNFGDGVTSDDRNPTHAYSSLGTYSVKLRACDEVGCCDTDQNNKTKRIKIFIPLPGWREIVPF